MHQHSCGCSCSEPDGEKFTLYRFINTLGLRALNGIQKPEVIFKAESEKKDGKYLESEDDDQLIIIIPFTGSVKLRKITVMASGDTAPTELQIFKNNDTLTFDDVETTKCTQKLQLQEDAEGELEHSVMAAKFNDVQSLALFFSASYGGDVTRIDYIGLFGEYTKAQQPLLGVVYESKPQIQDHKTKDESGAHHDIGF